MVLERTKNTKRNIVFGFLNKIVTLLYPFVLRTIIIQKIGVEYLGLNSLFVSILAVLNMTELGFYSAVVFSMYKPISEDDDVTLCAILNFYRKVYRIVGLIILISGIAILPFIPKLIKGDVPADVNLYILYLIYLADTTLSYFLYAYKGALLNAYQRADIVSSINTITYVITYTLQLFIIIKTKDFYLYVIAKVFSTILINISTAVCTKKLFPQLECKGVLDESVKDQIKVKIKGLMINKITGVSRNCFDSIFLSMYVGLVETAIYNNYYLILHAVTGFVIILTGSMEAGIGNSVAMESEEKNYEDFRKINFIFMWISSWCFTCMLCLYQPFTELFFGKDMLFPFATMVVFCLYFYQLRTGDILSVYSNVHGIWWEQRPAQIAEAIANFVLNAVLGKFFGVLGIALATFISMFITGFFIGSPIGIKYCFPSVKYSSYVKMHLLYFTITIIVSTLVYELCHMIHISNIYIYFTVCLAICVIVPNILLLLAYFRLNIFKISYKWLISKIFQR